LDNIEIAANDSAYVFISDPIILRANLLLCSRRVLINYNGNDRFVQLEAYGQKRQFLRNRRINA
jgi:hypothetical protein